MKRLHELGARKFIVVGVGPLGCIPFIRAINLLPNGHCFGEVNDLIQGYNKKLNGVLDQLNQELGPEAIFVYANSYDIFMKIIVNYHQYGKPTTLFLIFTILIILFISLINLFGIC